VLIKQSLMMIFLPLLWKETKLLIYEKINNILIYFNFYFFSFQLFILININFIPFNSIFFILNL